MILSTPDSRFVSVNGVRLHYLDFGGSGPPAVLHHGTGFHAWLWAPIARALSRRYRVVALDARGHGDSGKPEGGYRWETFVGDLIAFVEATGLAGGLGVGHSLGATTTAAAAAERPDLFSRVVLLDPILLPRGSRPDVEGESPISTAARRRRERWTSVEEAYASYRGRGAFARWPDAMLRLYVEYGFVTENGGVRLKCPPAVEAQVFDMRPHLDGWAALARIGVPALLLRGADSEALSENDVAKVRRRLPRAEIGTIEGATHTFPMEKPDRVADTILAFADAPLPIATRGLGHLALNVRALEETVRFYREVFGMRVVWQPDADNVYLSSGRDNLALHRAREPRATAGSPLDHLGFLVEAPERVFAIAEALGRGGVPIVRPPTRHRDGSCSLYVRDPDGNVVQILYEPNAARP